MFASKSTGTAGNAPLQSGGLPSGGSNSGGYLSNAVDAEEASTQPKFGDVYQKIQAKYGEKPEKPREIKKTLGKDDFLRIMITQMKNQDPTNPFKAEQMATEIAQFTSVEQLQNVNQNLNKMASQNRPLEHLGMTQLIGKMVTIDRERFPHSEGQQETLSFNLPKNAATTKVAIMSDAGEMVFEKELGKKDTGPVEFIWDGNKSNRIPAKAGNYMIRVEAKDDRGQTIETNPQLQAKVIGISFEGTDPVFLVGDARHQDKVTMKNIIRVELDQNLENKLASKISNTSSESVPIPPPLPKANFFEFQKGVGSKPLSDKAISQRPDLIEVIDKINEEKGFPNGISEQTESKGGESQ